MMPENTGEMPSLSELFSQIREDWETHWRDWTLPGFRAVAVYRVGRWQATLRGRTLRVRIARRIIRIAHKVLYRYVRNHYGINLPRTARIGRRLYIPHQSAIIIHPRATIGDDCVIRQGVTIGAVVDLRAEEPPRIGDQVEIGVGAMILGPVSIGDGARIGPGAIVMKDVPPGATAFSDPARVIFPPIDEDEERPPASSVTGR